MPSRSNSSRLVTETLGTLDLLRSDPMAVDLAYEDERISPSTLLMTSIGERRRAAVTPAYPGIAMKWNLAHRLLMARAHNRPFVEAGISYSREAIMAHVTLRLCMNPYEDRVLETAWGYKLDPIYAHTTTTEEVLAAIQESGETGEPVSARSGLVVVSTEKMTNGNWSISDSVNPDDAVAAIHNAVIENLCFQKI